MPLALALKKSCFAILIRKLNGGQEKEINVFLSFGFKSSVISVSFHPSGRLVAAGSTDGTMKILSSYLPSIDTVDDKTIIGQVFD